MSSSRVFAVAVCALLSGCAMVTNPGKSRSVVPPEGGQRVKVARLRLEHTGPVLDVYNGTTRLQIRDAATEEDRVFLCRRYEAAAMDPPGMVTVSVGCMNSILMPYVELPKSGTHSLRLVRNGQETTVSIKASTHWQWFWLNGVCLPLVWACWGLDIATGSWSYFGSLDVDHAMRSPSVSTAAVSHD